MYLPTIQGHEPTEAAGRFGRAVTKARKTGSSVPQIYHLFAWRPAAAKHLGAFMQEVMRGPSELSAGFRELIAAWTSRRNDCLF